MNWTKKQISILAIVAVTSFMSTFLISSVSIALPAIEKSFGLDAVSLSWIMTAYLLSTAMFLLPLGRWGDLKGIRKLFKLGIIIFTLSSIGCALSPTGGWLTAFRFLEGISAALASTSGPAILVSTFEPQKRGQVLGISVSAVYLGLAFGPFAGGMLTEHFDWRAIFVAASALGVIMAILTFLFLGVDEKIEAKNRTINFRDTLIYMLGLMALVYGSSEIPLIKGWIFLLMGVIALIFFWFSETKSANPIIETKLFTTNRLFAFSNLAALINYSATFAIIFLLSLYLQKTQALSPQQAGLILISQPIVMALFSPIAGRLSDRIHARYLSTIGMTMCTIGLIAFSQLTTTTPIWQIVAILIWVGLGFAFFSSPNMNTIMSSVNKAQYGLASGSAATMRVLGQIVSMTIATLFFAVLFDNHAIETVSNLLFMKAINWGFATFSAISIAGIYFSYNRGEISDINH